MTLTEYLALFISIGAMCMDLRSRRVANWLLLAGGGAAVAVRLAAGAFAGGTCITQVLTDGACIAGALTDGALRAVPDLAAGGLLPLVLLGWLFLFRMIGAADVKLLMVLGILFGAADSLRCVFWTMVFGALISLGIMLAYGSMRERFAYLAAYVRRWLVTRQREPYRGAWDERSNLHMTVPVLMAVLTVLGLAHT